MKNNIKIILPAIILGLIFASAVVVSAQIKTGGFKVAAVDDNEVIAAAEFAVITKGEKEEMEISLDSILKAERQTVAGTNFRLCLSVLLANPEDAVEEIFVRTVVFKSLKKGYTLKSWTEVENCRK